MMSRYDLKKQAITGIFITPEFRLMIPAFCIINTNLSIHIISNATSLVVADVLTKEKGISFDTLGGRFYGIGFCALNQSSENKELAGNFLRFLFSKEAQNSDLYNGFPVRTECIEEWFLTTTKMQEDIYFGFSAGDSDVLIEGGYPSKKCRKRMVDLIGGLTEMVDENTLWCEQMLEALDAG